MFSALAAASVLAFLVFFLPAGNAQGQIDCTSFAFPPSPAERDVLIKFYCDTGGPNWTDSTNWGSMEPLSRWHGVKLDGGGKVRSLILENNRLSGAIPSELGDLTAMQELNLYSNRLSGAIPSSLGKLTGLGQLRLNENQLSGTIPSSLGGLTDLRQLRLSENDLSGNIPADLGDLTFLGSLYLYENRLDGTIPSELGELTLLQDLRLQSNRLSGAIPSELGELTGLGRLYLSENQLSGAIPSSLGKLTLLWQLSLHSNRLSGNIPAELGKLTLLQDLYLNENQLSGTIPSELGNLTRLQWLSLHSNRLSGNIPTEFEKLTGLRRLYVHSNRLGGTVPTKLNDFSGLSHISLWSNSGMLLQSAGSELFSKLDRTALFFIYSENNGPRWKNKGNWFSSGDFSTWHGVTVDEGRITGLSLEDNNLTGGIDDAFSGLRFLKSLNVSGNRSLTGVLPLGLMDLSDLATLNVRCTGVSAPGNQSFTAWLSRIAYTPSSCGTVTTPVTPTTPDPPEQQGMIEDRPGDVFGLTPGGTGTSVVSHNGEDITIEVMVTGEQEPEGLPSIILSSDLLGDVEEVSFTLSVPEAEDLQEGLRLVGFVTVVDIQYATAGELVTEVSVGHATAGDNAVTVCLPLPVGTDESMTDLYRRDAGSWVPVAGSEIDTVNDIRSVCAQAQASSLPSSFVAAEKEEPVEPPVMEEEESDGGGGCSVVFATAGRSGSTSMVFNLLLIMSCLLCCFPEKVWKGRQLGDASWSG